MHNSVVKIECVCGKEHVIAIPEYIEEEGITTIVDECTCGDTVQVQLRMDVLEVGRND